MSEWKKQGNTGNTLLDIKEKVGQETIGVYKGLRHVEKVDSNIHTIETKDGLFDFWGSGLLDYLLKTVALDTEVKIVYLGKQKIKVDIKGKKVSKEVHQFEVYSK